VRIRYLANVRLPTEKAHGLQIAQNCGALAAAGAEITLVVPRRINTPALAHVDVYDHYGMPQSFALTRVPCLDLLPWAGAIEQPAAILQMISFAMAAALSGKGRADVYYSRDVLPLLLLAFTGRSRRLVYEAHQFSLSRIGAWLQRQCLRRCEFAIAVTEQLAADLRQRGGRRVLVLRDGFQASRFEDLPARQEARSRLHLPSGAFLVGYVGRLETMGMSKGLDVLIDAIVRLGCADVEMVLVGGPTTRADALRAQWIQSGLPSSACHLTGDVPPSQVPAYIAAFDVCVSPLPATRHFDQYASPLKLFEYMAAGKPIVASALHSTAEVLVDGETALLVPPGDAERLSEALARLMGDAALRARLGAAAREAAAGYSWDERARRILAALAPDRTSHGQEPDVPNRPTTRGTRANPATVRTT
jgi:glycosyltransferase involved in cell wall biosynthesis